MVDRSRRAASSPTPSTASDEDLLARCAEGDESAFATLYDRYAGRVYGLVRRVLRDPSQSEEVAQEVFVEAWRTASRYDPRRGAVASWLLTLAHRRAVDRVRSEQASRDRQDLVAARTHEAEHDPVAEGAEVAADHERVREALGALTDLQREAIELAYFGGRTHREVAEVLDAPLGTVKGRLRDGLLKLREALEVSR